MNPNKTISAVHVLKTTQINMKQKFGNKYAELIEPFITIIDMVMKANAINEFEAMKKIKDELPVYKKPGADLWFASALYEIIEATRFAELKAE